MRSLIYTISFILICVTAHGASLELSSSSAPETLATPSPLKDQIPHSKVAHGEGDIARAYLSSPTMRYTHGVLGDRIEAASLTLVLSSGKEVKYELPETRVFEDLVPRLVNLDGEGADEIVVVETDKKLGASLAVYRLHKDKLEKIATTLFIGRSSRWLNPVGAGDFNGDSVMDLALVSTPHIGGILKLYSFTPPGLISYAQKSGVSTHSIGSTALGMGTVVKGERKDLILAPSQRHDELLLFEWADGTIIVKARIALPADMIGDLVPSGFNQWTVRLENGSWYTVHAAP